jgi:hypothetical protein
VKRRHLISHSGYHFFTLPTDYKIQLHTQLWEMVQFGNGFSWRDVYTMPLHLRKFYFNKLLELKKKESEEYKKIEQKSKVKVRK